MAPKASEEHKFDRRVTDANVAALATRVTGLEGRMSVVESELAANTRELVANTALTKQVHEMAERTEKNTKQVVSAVQWLGTTRALIVAVGSLAGSVLAVGGVGKLFGWW